MVAKVLGLGRSFTRLAGAPPRDGRAGRLGRHPEPADAGSGTGGAADGRDGEGGARPQAAGWRIDGGRKLEKPVLHYSLYWPHDQRPVRAEMERAAAESLTALGLERHEALIVAHHGHLHVIANRVHPETGRAANLGLGWIRLSEWAERWEHDHGGIRCHERVKNNARRR